MSNPAARLDDIRGRIAAAAARAGRAPNEVRLIAVSKRHRPEAVQALAELGVRDFGESQIQEAMDKIPAVARPDLSWHFIGHLQSNKTRHVPQVFDWVHSLDSLKLARRINEAATVSAATVQLLIQVNVARDPAKHGVEPQALFALVDSILAARLENVRLRGLMTIGLRSADEPQTRAGFSALRELLAGCETRFGEQFSELSMGMSGDYEWAIEEGATQVRVGTALFGERN